MDKHDYNPELVKQARVSAGFARQEDVAEHLGCSRKLVSECETGVYVSFEWLKRFAYAYGKPVKHWLADPPQDDYPENKTTEKILASRVT